MSSAEQAWKASEIRRDLGFRAGGQDFSRLQVYIELLFECGSECAFGGKCLILPLTCSFVTRRGVGVHTQESQMGIESTGNAKIALKQNSSEAKFL